MPPSHSAVLSLRWPGRCSVCGKTLAAGERAQWDASPRRITCLECVAAITAGKRIDLDTGTPGASAQREYQRRRAARELRARQRLGLLGVGLAKISGDPWSTLAWRKGAEGEARVARRLAQALDGKGVHLLHDRLLPGATRANIDHLATGPGGVTVIDSKNLHGKVRVETIGMLSQRRTLLRVNGRDRTALAARVQRQAEAVRQLLRDAGFTIEVRAALCFASVEGLPLLRRLEVDGVLIDRPGRVAALAARAGSLTPEQTLRLHMQLASRLRAA